MITPNEIKQKAERKYIPFLRAVLQEEPFFPWTIPVGKLPDDYLKIKDAVEKLQKGSKERVGYGYRVELSPQKTTRRYGTQSFPCRIVIEEKTDYLKFIKKEKEFATFKEAVALIRSEVPQLNSWLNQNPQKIIEYSGKWAELLRVCLYFQAHPKPGLYIRELPINVHTKFIEEHKGILSQLLEAVLPDNVIQKAESDFEKRFSLRSDEPLIRVRILDESLRAKYTLPFSDFSTPVSQFESLNLQGHRFIITENKMNFLTLPALSDSFALFGGGFNISILKNINWLASCPLLYWGDLDAHGFIILSQLRSYFPQTISVMMDEETFGAFKEFSVTGTVCSIEKLPYLTLEEHDLFTRLSKQTIRLEQERIGQDFVIHMLDNIA